MVSAFSFSGRMAPCRKPDSPLVLDAVKGTIPLPRLMIAGLSGESGKTVVALGLLLAARERGISVRAFKKGPDYIDAAWLGWASGNPARNLDTFLMGFQIAASSFARHALPDGLNVIEANRGLYDGMDVQGTHSSAELAKALRVPVVLVVNATKVTRTTAACVLGCQKLDPEVQIAGVILNRVAGRRHEQVLRQAVETICGIPVLGVLPRARPDTLLPERHMGLVTPQEHPVITELGRNVMGLVANQLDVDRLLAIAHQAPPVELTDADSMVPVDRKGLKLGYIRDSAFTFYYPENLEALEASGAELVPFSALSSSELPEDLDALYIGGGFPETHGVALSANQSFLESLRERARAGLPIYAECGGLMLLSRAIRWKGCTYPMAGVLPFDMQVCDAPQGHGYARLSVDRSNPFFRRGLVLKGHEFHYSKILLDGDPPPTACAVDRGTGCYAGRDGVIVGNILASYVHLHALATPEWAAGLLDAARSFSGERSVTSLTIQNALSI